jgi:putative hydrolase of the HAD superfamily
MVKLAAIGFDADDTLWENERLYQAAKEEFARLLSGYVPADQAKAVLDATEIRNVEVYGYGIKSFTLSMVETATQVSGGCVQANEIEELLQISKRMLRAEVELMGDVENVLAELAPKYPLLLITKGDLFEQERKMQRSGLVSYFRRVAVVGDKTRETYLRLLGEEGIAPEQFLMVGNSLRSDILPVAAIGGWAVLIPHPLTWSHEANPGEEIPDGRWFEIAGLGELPELIDRILEDER